jgi:hypothetical protein
VNEIFPVLAGILSAVSVWKYFPLRFRALALGVLGVIFGTIAAFISGEMFISWLFVVIDTALVLLSATATAVLITGGQWMSRRTR